MGTGDGSVGALSRVVDHGDSARRWNLVVMGDGYRAAELTQFALDAKAFANTLLTTPPFDRLARAVNIYRIDVASTDTGADDPVSCGGTGVVARTYFDAAFCNSGIRRALTINRLTATRVLFDKLPAWHAGIVIVNSPIYGGTGGAVACYSKAASAERIAIHELGHSAFGLADEYEYYQGCGIDTDRDNYSGSEPSQPNVTKNTNRMTLKWGDLVRASTTLPTMKNPNCANCDNRPSTVASGTVGTFEGAGYYHCGLFRPEFDCCMRHIESPFCSVCSRVIEQTLTPFLPMVASAERILRTGVQAKNVADQGGQRSILTVTFDVYRRGPSHVCGLTVTTDGWVNTKDVAARFTGSSGDVEHWRCEYIVAGQGVTFEYVLYCYDYRDVGNVRRIYDNDGGDTYISRATW